MLLARLPGHGAKKSVRSGGATGGRSPRAETRGANERWVREMGQCHGTPTISAGPSQDSKSSRLRGHQSTWGAATRKGIIHTGSYPRGEPPPRRPGAGRSGAGAEIYALTTTSQRGPTSTQLSMASGDCNRRATELHSSSLASVVLRIASNFSLVWLKLMPEPNGRWWFGVGGLRRDLIPQRGTRARTAGLLVIAS